MSDASRPRRLRWGLLGTARVNRVIIPAVRATAHSEVAAVASRDAARADAYAREWEIPRSHGRYEDLLAAPDIDVVYVPLPNSLHVEWTLAAIAAGKHVLCEKPLALDVDDVDRVREAAARAGVVVTEAFMYRPHAQTRDVQRLVAGGAIGRLSVMRVCLTYVLDRPGDVRFDPALGGGCLWDAGCYAVSFFRLLAGRDPLEVFGQSTVGPTGVDETFSGLLRFADGVHAHFDSSFRASYRPAAEIGGSDANLVLPNPFKPGEREEFVIWRGDEPSTVAVEGRPRGHDLVEDVARAVLTGSPPTVDLAESRAVVAVVRALYASAALGRPLAV